LTTHGTSYLGLIMRLGGVYETRGDSVIRMEIARKGLTALAGVVLVIGTVLADPHSEGTELGKSNLSKLSSNVTSSNAKAMPFYTDKPSQSSHFGSTSLFNVGTGRINTCKTEPDGPDDIANQECAAVNFLAKNPYERVKVDVDENDPIISGIGEIINNAKPGDITENCGTKTTTTPDIYSTEVCNEYNLSEAKACSMGQVVNVDTKANFQCNVTQNAVETVTCDKYLVLSCQPPIAGCTGSGIAVNSATISNGAYQFTLVGSALTIINNVTAINEVTEANFNFSIAGLDRVDEFFINAIHSDNYVGIEINGTFIGVHGRAFGGWNPNATKLVQDNNYRPPHARWSDNPSDHNTAETGTNLKTNEHINLIPYLREGSNVINIKVLNGKGPGYGMVYITAHQQCPPDCQETWVDQCSAYDQRSQ
ncbi:hypothetical protein QVM41_31345, partial [Pseudomonas shirazica]|uniref:hypothetical protein n=2 Tax=Pseudomonas TaxID=286 RepID=UPI0035258047